MNTPDSYQRASCSREGFTLIELLASVCVVAVLSALLLPALTRMRSGASSMQCMSNLRQVYLAYATQAGENDGRIPESFDYSPDVNKAWVDSYSESLGGNWQLSTGGDKAAAVVGCPEQRRKLKQGPNRRTFSINLRLTDNPILAGNNQPPPKLGMFSQPSKTGLISDGVLKSATSTSAGFSYDKLPDRVHLGRANILFLDGHAESWGKPQWDAVASAPPSNPNNVGTPLSLFWLGI